MYNPTKPISIQCEADTCIHNTSGICNHAINTGVIEISENKNNFSAVCVNYINKQHTNKESE